MNRNLLLDTFFSDYSDYKEKVRCRNKVSVYEIIEKLMENGPDNLQVITDFDYTLSKHHTKDKTLTPAADIIRMSSHMSDEFRMRSRQRFDKLLPIELDASLTIEQKIPAVIASFEEGFADIVDSKVVNRKVLAQMISEAGDDFQLRDRCHETLQCLYNAKIPVLIFSAGFGDLVKGILHKHNLYYSNINVIGNFMEFDDCDRLVGFHRPLIHTFNKNSSVIPANCFDELSYRNNVILLGDSIGDVSMAEGVRRCGNLLKIGFLNEVNEEQLNIFLDTFDIVLLDDQTTNFVNFLLKRIISHGAQ